MQSNRSRVALAVVAVALAAVAFLVLRPADDEEGTSAPSAAQGPSPAPDEEDSGSGGGGGEDGGVKRDKPDSVEIEVTNGAPVGGVADVEVAKGNEVLLEVSADTEDVVHVHGYDQFAGVAPDDPAEFKFIADLEGIYEIELEGSHTQIARLEVTP